MEMDMKAKTLCAVSAFLVVTSFGATHASTIAILTNATAGANEVFGAVPPLQVDANADPIETNIAVADVEPDAASARSRITVDPQNKTQRMEFDGTVAANQPDKLFRVFGRATDERRYTALTAGTVSLTYTLDVTHDFLTDLGPLSNYFGFGVRLEFDADLPSAIDYISFFNFDPIFDQPNGTKSISVSLDKDFDAGDEFGITARLNSTFGREVPFGAFFDGSLLLDGAWSISSTGDLDLVIGDTTLPAPVPLPAGLPLLLAGLLSFGFLNRLSKKHDRAHC